MRIESIRLKDFKGVTGIFNLGPLNFLTGPNGSGKTAVLSAIQFACEGKVPQGGRLEDVASLAGPNGCAVTVTLDDGFAWTRGIEIDHREAKTSQTLRIAGRDDLGVKAADAALKEKLGRNGEIFAPMFDLRAFTDLSPDKKRSAIMDLCAAAFRSEGAVPMGDPAQLKEALEIAFFRAELGEGTVATILDAEGTSGARLATILKLRNRVAPGRLEALDRILSELVLTTDPVSSLGLSVEKADAVKNSAKRGKEQAFQAAQRLAARRAELPTSAGTPEDLAGQQSKLREELTDVARQIALQAGKASARYSLEAQLRNARERAHDCAVSLAGLRIDGTPAKVDQLDAEAKAIGKKQYETIDTSGPRAELDALTQRRRSEEQRAAAIQAERAALKRQIEQIHTETAQAKESPAVELAVAWEEYVAAIDISAESRTATALRQKLADLVSRVSEHEMQRLAKLIDQQADLVTRRQALDGEAQGLGETIASLNGAIVEINAALEGLHERERAVQAERLSDGNRRSELTAAATTIRAALDRKGALEASLAEAEALTLDAERKLGELDAQGGHIATDELVTRQVSLDSAITDLDRQIAAKREFATLDTELKATQAKAESEATLWEVAGLFGQAVRTVREQLMLALVQPLLRRMDAFLAAALDRRCYCRLENDKGTTVFDLGWIDADGRRVAYPALSGGEQVMFGAALAFALIGLADPPLRLFSAEVAELDYLSLGRLLTCLYTSQALVSNVLIAAHQVAPEGADDEWTVMPLGGGRVAEAIA